MKRPSHLQVVPASKTSETAEETQRLLQLLKSKDQEIQQLKALDENQNHIK